jgi:hypothetical protein
MGPQGLDANQPRRKNPSADGNSPTHVGRFPSPAATDATTLPTQHDPNCFVRIHVGPRNQWTETQRLLSSEAQLTTMFAHYGGENQVFPMEIHTKEKTFRV